LREVAVIDVAMSSSSPPNAAAATGHVRKNRDRVTRSTSTFCTTCIDE
jgi:hypothetical protein